jgi:D-glycero-alpha-D-manno-heptose-7-phosphate kinase
MVISQTPYRISFFGGGTDYPVWAREHGGAVLTTSIDKYLYTSVRLLPPFHEHKFRITYSKIENVHSIDEIAHPAVREVFRYMNVTDGLEMHTDSDLPARSGIGSSSSFVVGLLNSLYALQGKIVDKERLAQQSIHIEQTLLKENVGCQDQIIAAYGGLNHIQFHTNGSFSVQPITIKENRLKDLQRHLMLFYTGTTRVASVVAAEQIKNTPKRQNELKAIHQMVAEGLKILNSDTRITDFGALLHEGWQMKKQLSDKISNPLIDEIYSAGQSAGAIGGKLLGAGSGGFMLMFVPPEKQFHVAEKLGKLLPIKFSFESGGSKIIFYRQAVA